MKRHPEVNTSKKLDGGEGFEPSLHGPEPCVLPLDYSPATDVRCHLHDVTESKSGRFFGVVNGIIPLNLPQKRAGIGQLLQSLLSYPGIDENCDQLRRKK